MNSIKNNIALLLTVTSGWLFAQNPDQEVQEIQAAQAIDSTYVPQSELVARIGFDGHVLVAGRDWDIAQTAIMPSIMYFHKSGFNGGLSSSILSNTEPKYNQTTLNLGYGRGFGDHFYSALTYNHFFFNPNTEGLIQNSVNLFLNYSLNWFSAGASYTTLFEPEKAQQLNLSLSGFFEKQHVGKIESLSFSPNIALLLGTETVVLQRFGGNLFQKATGKKWEKRLPIKRPKEDEIAPLSLTFGLPISANFGRFQGGLNLNYVVPIKHKGEILAQEDLEKTFFMSASVSYKLFQH
jgi:hypothetical protein